MSRQTLSSYPQVIVAGMSRTGTESIIRALEILYGNGTRAYQQIIFGDNAFDESGAVREVMIDAYRRHNEQVRKSIAPNWLLEFNVQQGWTLCDFLEFDVPQCDFPHLNTGTSGSSKIIAKAVSQLSLRRILIAAGIVIVFSIISTKSE